jgi:hypothetical protein
MTDSNSEKGIPRLVQCAVRSHPCNIVSRACRFASSSHSVLSSPLKSKPRRHFSVEYWPSPFNSLFREMGLFSSTSSGGNTSCIPIIVARAVWRSCCFECGMITLMKLLTYTSVMFHRGLSDSPGSVAVDGHVSVWCSNLCSGSVLNGVLVYCMITSRPVSVAAQKKVGDSIHPIWRDVGTTSWTGLPGGWGRT